MTVYALPLDHELTDDELAVAVAHAILDPQLNPGMGHPFVINALVLIHSLLGVREGTRLQGSILTANGGAPRLEARLNELCWRWVVAGVLVPANGQQSGSFYATAAGAELLRDMSGDELIPLIPGRLAQVLRERCIDISEITVAYADRAQDCFLAGHYEASVVVLGAASETVLIRLAESLAVKQTGLGIRRLRATTALRRLSQLESLLRDEGGKIKKALVDANLDYRWVDDLPQLLGGANAIRLTRNDAGHPTRLLVRRRHEALGLLTLFPQLAEAVTATAVSVERLQ